MNKNIYLGLMLSLVIPAFAAADIPSVEGVPVKIERKYQEYPYYMSMNLEVEQEFRNDVSGVISSAWGSWDVYQAGYIKGKVRQ